MRFWHVLNRKNKLCVTFGTTVTPIGRSIHASSLHSSRNSARWVPRNANVVDSTRVPWSGSHPDTCGPPKKMLWIEEILHQLVDCLSHYNLCFFAVFHSCQDLPTGAGILPSIVSLLSEWPNLSPKTLPSAASSIRTTWFFMSAYYTNVD